MLIRDFGSHFSPSLSQGLGVIGTLLFNKGHEVKIFDNNSFYIRYSHKQILNEVEKFSPDIIGFNMSLLNARLTYRLVARIKQAWPHVPIISGGIHMRHCGKEALEHKIDVVVNDEGDEIICDLVDAIMASGDSKGKLLENIKPIPGISYLDEAGGYHTCPFEASPFLKDLDSLPFTNYDLFNLKDYIKVEDDNVYLGYIVTQRGCPYPCNFCSETYMYSSIRENSAEYIVEYIKYLNQRYGVTVIGFGDNNFTLSKKRTTEFCQKIIDSGLNQKISFYCQTNVKTNITDEMARELKRASCTHITLGVERMTEEGKQRINKPVEDEKVLSSINAIYNNGMNVNCNMLIGFPWDTKELILEEEKLFDRFSSNITQMQVNVFMPIPGTEYYDNNPSVSRWYLDDSYFRAYDTYFAQVLNAILGEDLLKVNHYKLSPDTLATIKSVYYRNLIRTYIKRTKMFNKRYLFLIVQGLDLGLAGVSFIIYMMSSKLESFVFSKIKQLRFLLGTIFAAKKIAQAGLQSKTLH